MQRTQVWLRRGFTIDVGALTTHAQLMSNNASHTARISPDSILWTLRNKIESLPDTIPLAQRTHVLASFSQEPKALTKDILLDEEVWEVWDQKLNVLLPHSIEDLKPLVIRGQYGLIGLIRLLEHLIHDRKVSEGLLEGKIGHLIEAIDRYVLLLCYSHTNTHFL